MSFPLVFMLLGLLIFFVTMAWLRGRHRGRSARPSRSLAHFVLLGFVCLLMLLVFFRFSARTRTDALREAYSEYPRAVLETPTSPTTEGTPFWQVTVENDFEADLYPSLNAAARALARKIAPKAASFLAANDADRQAYIQASGRMDTKGRTLEDQALEEVRQELLAIIKLPGLVIRNAAEVELSTGPVGPPDRAMVVTVGIPEIRSGSAPWSHTQEEQRDGELTVSVRYGDEHYRESARFIEKPWVTDYAAFLSRQPQEDYLIAQSTRVCTQPADARAGALDNAAEQLALRILHNAGAYHRQYRLGNQSWNLRDLRALVRGELERQQGGGPNAAAVKMVSPGGGTLRVSKQSGRANPLLCDRFVQCFGRPYGQIWREALLVRADKRNLDELAGMYAATLEQQRRSWFMIAVSTAGMLLLVCLLYFFLNAATKGYYSLTLKVLAGIVLGLFFLIIYMVMH